MMLRKKALALAVAGAIGVPVAAYAQSNVEIYGKLYPQFAVVSGSGATAAGPAGSSLSGAPTGLNIEKRNEVEASNSRFGVRGSEDLGGGTKAIYQIETKVSIDSGLGGVLATRDSFVGLDGGFGTVKLGNMDTVYKNIGDPLRFLGISSGNFPSTSNIISKPGFGTNAASSFHIRRPNSVYYESPKFSGFQVLGQYSPGESKGNPTGVNGNNAYLTSFGLQYKQGNLSAAIATETHNDFFGASTNLTGTIANSVTGAAGEHSKDTANRGAVMYRFGDTRVSLDVTSTQYKESGATVAGRFESYKHNAWALVAEQKMGAWTGGVEYASSAAGSCTLLGASCNTSGLDGKMFVLGGLYSFSKTTGMFLLYSRLTNGAAAIYNNTANVTPTPGMDITQMAVGVLYAFGGSGGGD